MARQQQDVVVGETQGRELLGQLHLLSLEDAQKSSVLAGSSSVGEFLTPPKRENAWNTKGRL